MQNVVDEITVNAAAHTGEVEIMSTQVTATFVNGMLKPDQALPLAEHARVRLTIQPLEDWSPESGRAAWEALKAMIRERPSILAARATRGMSSMNAVDTNVFVYALDADDPVNRPRHWTSFSG